MDNGKIRREGKIYAILSIFLYPLIAMHNFLNYGESPLETWIEGWRIFKEDLGFNKVSI